MIEFINSQKSILVDPQKRSFVTPYIVLIFLTIFVFSPTITYAGSFSDFAYKVKAIFIKNEEISENESGTSQTMALFKPNVVEAASVSGEANEDIESGVLQATAGSLRISTEDIDFPTTDTISVYEVKKGDSLATIAKLFGVSKNTIMWANDLKSESVKLGEILVILPMTGIKHNIKKGETIKSIAKKYKADEGDIAKFNGIADDSDLSVGETILVPDGEIAIAQPTKSKSKSTGKSRVLNSYSQNAPSDFFIKPASGRRSQGIHGHNGIDIAAPQGTPILASASGRVIVAKNSGYNGGYGKLIIMTHDNGVQTVYAHLREVYVSSGQDISQGTVIGEMGNTGRSTGSHLHFEVRGVKNPF